MLTTALKVGKWFVAGSSWSGFATACAITALAASGGFVGGYIRGYAKADRAAEVRTLKATVQALQHDIDRRDDADALASEQAAEQAASETHNAEVSRDIETVIAAAPAVPGCMSGAFLERLRSLK
jgi:outer membrane murein-binding lipoprotein Lpp